jgi:hypothetical protein
MHTERDFRQMERQVNRLEEELNRCQEERKSMYGDVFAAHAAQTQVPIALTVTVPVPPAAAAEVRHNGRYVGKVTLHQGMTRDDLIAKIVQLSDLGRTLDPRPTPNKYPSADSISANVKGLQTLYNLSTGTSRATHQMPGDSIAWLNDVGAVKEQLDTHYKTNSSRTTTATKVTAVLSWIYGAESLLSQYSGNMNSSAQIRDEDIAENKMSEKQLERYVPWDQIIKTFNKDVVKIKDRFLLGLNILWAPRRLDLRFLKLKLLQRGITGDQLKDDRVLLPLQHETNYIVFTGAVCFLVFDEFKTKGTFGRQVFEMQGPLVKIIKQYIAHYDLSDGDVLIPQVRNKTKILSESDMSKLMSKKLDIYFHNGMSQTSMRSSYSNFIHSKNYSEGTLRTLTARLAHSVETSRIYYRKVE